MNRNQFSYQVSGQEINLPIDPDHIALKFYEPFPRSARSKFVTENKLLGEFSKRVEIPGEKFTIFTLLGQPKNSPHASNKAFTFLNQSDEIKKVIPVFKSGNKKVVATDRVIIGFQTTGFDSALLLKKYNCEEIESSYNEMIVRIPEAADIFDLMRLIELEKGVIYVEPDFITIGSNNNRKNDYSFTESIDKIDDKKDLSKLQYALKLTMAEEAWKIQLGNKNIKIAILDEGVETTHPDLKEVIEKSFDATDDDTFQEPNSWDGHGTACCGLAAAQHKKFGIKGLSGGCAVYAVRLAYSKSPESEWITSNSIIRRAIDWSWKSGADVLSNSWGGGAPSNAITNAFNRARENGRNGKGCVVIIAAGNEDAKVSYPGNLDEVLTVSASNEYDEPKTKFSQDGEYWWGSCFGAEVDVAAPGVHNLTTDISGSKGYNKEHNYTDFNGTSSSTPIVAGIAALMLSANPTLTEKEVRDIIKQTADKVGHVPYDRGHNHRMGFGRVNALKAVNAALRVTNNDEPSERLATFVQPPEELNHLAGTSINIF